MNVTIGSLFRPIGSKYISQVYVTRRQGSKYHVGLVEMYDVLFHSSARNTLEESLEVCQAWCKRKGHEFTIDPEIEIMPTPMMTNHEELYGVTGFKDSYQPRIIRTGFSHSMK